MGSANPYQSPDCDASQRASSGSPRSHTQWILLGFLAGAAIPIAFGGYGAYQHAVFIASLPPATPASGTGLVAALTMIVVFGPVGGLIGAFCGWVGPGFKR